MNKPCVRAQPEAPLAIGFDRAKECRALCRYAIGGTEALKGGFRDPANRVWRVGRIKARSEYRFYEFSD